MPRPTLMPRRLLEATAVLSLFTSSHLGAAAAQGLASHPCDLRLPGIKTIDVATARGLASHRGLLDVDRIEMIDGDALAALLGNRGTIDLGGLRSLGQPVPDNVLEAIVAHEGTLGLSGLGEMPPELAAAVAKVTIAPRHDEAFLHPPSTAIGPLRRKHTARIVAGLAGTICLGGAIAFGLFGMFNDRAPVQRLVVEPDKGAPEGSPSATPSIGSPTNEARCWRRFTRRENWACVCW